MRKENLKTLKLKLALVVLSMILLSVSCNNEKEQEEKTETLSSVETNPPNTKYEPAFKGQTRISGVVTTTKYKTTLFAKGLDKPWAMENLPDGRILVTQKEGTMRIVSQNGSIGSAITGIPTVNSNGQGGLLDVAVDPNFTSNRMIYWTFAKSGSNGNATAVAKGRLSNDEKTIENAVVIYTALPEFDGNLHYGSRLAWDKQGNLFVSTGERSSTETRADAQKLNSALGKILRITTNGQPAAGNPFINQANALPEIYSYGHRNVQGLAIDPTTGDLWESEFGPLGGDEVNKVVASKNYGWPTITYGLEYSRDPIGQSATQQQGMEQPIYYWDPSISPSGITFYSGTLIQEWTNNLFLAALSGQHVARLVVKDNKVIGEERLLTSYKSRFRDVLEGKDGALYALTDGNNALIYRIGIE